MVYTYTKKDSVATIQVRLLEIKDDAWVIKRDKQHEDGYYEFLIRKSELVAVLNSDDKKWAIYDHLVASYNRSFMEFLMNDLYINECYLASVLLECEGEDLEFSYLESEYMDDSSSISGDIRIIYSEKVGMMSDFDYYPYGLV